MNTAIDRRKHYIAVIDTETAGTLNDPLVYDFALAIVDKQGNIYSSMNYIIEEVFTDLQTMEKAYYFSKYPKYQEMIEKGVIEVKPWEKIKKAFREIISYYRVQTIAAYNLAFDLKSLELTNAYISPLTKKVVPDSLHKLDIWTLFIDTIAVGPTYRNWCIATRHYKTKTQIPRTNAENAYRYITNNKAFKESHTALDDVYIECEIMARAFKQKKTYRRGLIQFPSSILKPINEIEKVNNKIWRGTKFTIANSNTTS